MMILLKHLFCLTALIICVAVVEPVRAESFGQANYSIISDKEFNGVRRSIEVRLDNKVSIETLKRIAQELKSSELHNYERTFIGYYLPDMEVGAGAWATTHFNPKLEVKILGLTADEEKKMTDAAKGTYRAVVGIWMDDRAYVGSTITIYRENEEFYLESKYKDGSSSIEEMSSSESTVGTKFVEKGGNPHGEYFLLDSKGDLHAAGKNGIFLKYKKIN